VLRLVRQSPISTDMFSDFMSLLFPQCCIISKAPLAKGEQFISTNCAQRLPKYDLTLPDENIHKRFYGLVNIQHALAYYKFAKNSQVQQLMHQLKYGGRPELGIMLAGWYGHALTEAGYVNCFDLILPVPMHRVKQKKRGYNQCDAIAEGLSVALKTPWRKDILEKTTNTATQTHKSRTERFANADSVYKVRHAATLAGKRILLVDDVITTGATLGVCATLLLQHPCASLSVAALAATE
jgi:ComF family protein